MRFGPLNLQKQESIENRTNQGPGYHLDEVEKLCHVVVNELLRVAQ